MFDSKTDTALTPPLSLDGKPAAKRPGLLVATSKLEAVTNARLFSLEQKTTIGRSSQKSNLVLQDPAVSKEHCVLFRRNNQTVIADPGSSNGVFVQGDRLRTERPLFDQETIRIAETLFVYHEDINAFLDSADHYAQYGLAGRFHSSLLVKRLKTVLNDAQPVLLAGPTGSGKELAATTLSWLLGFEGKYQAFNMARLQSPAEASSVIFGVADNAFTDVKATKGIIEAAHGGMLLLDEFSRLPTSLQRSLLRIMEDGILTRTGAVDAAKNVKVWFVCTTNSPGPEYGVAPDVLGRSNVVQVPPLCERAADIPEIFTRFLLRRLAEEKIASEPVLAGLRAQHYEHLILDGFMDFNVRALFRFANRMVAGLLDGFGPHEAFIEAKKDRQAAVQDAQHQLARRLIQGQRMVNTQTETMPDCDAPGITDSSGCGDDAGSVGNLYDVLRPKIVKLYVEHKANVSAIERELRAAGIRVTRKTLAARIEEWRLADLLVASSDPTETASLERGS